MQKWYVFLWSLLKKHFQRDVIYLLRNWWLGIACTHVVIKGPFKNYVAIFLLIFFLPPLPPSSDLILIYTHYMHYTHNTTP